MENSALSAQQGLASDIRTPLSFTDAQNLPHKIVKKVSTQLARPVVAGFQARLDREDFAALLKNVSSEKIEVLLDEYMVEFGGRRASLIEEMHSEDEVPLKELFYGEPGLMFGIIGEASTGKTSLLLHLQWRINCHHNRILRELQQEDTTWAYFQVPDSEDTSQVLLVPSTPLVPIHSQASTPGPATSSANASGSDRSDDFALRGLSASLSSTNPYPLNCPSRLVGIYVFGSELVRRDVGPGGSFDLATILEAAFSTYILRLPAGQISVGHDEFIQSYKAHIAEMQNVGIVLLVDGFDFVEQRQRSPLLSSLILTLQNPSTSIFRMFFGSRPNGLFKLDDIPDAIFFLCLDRLFAADWKEKLFSKLAPQVALKLKDLGRDHVESRIHRRLIRSCHSPLLVFLLAQLEMQPGADVSAGLFDVFERFFKLTVNKCKSNRGESLEMPSTHKIGTYELTENEFYQIVDMVVFFYHCWLPETHRPDWSTRERFEQLLYYLLKHQASFFQNTILGSLRDHFIQQRATSSSSPPSQSNPPTSNTPNPSQQADKACVELAGSIWLSVAEWLISNSMAHRLTSLKHRRNSNQAKIMAILQSNVQQPTGSSSTSNSSAGSSPNVPTSGTTTPSPAFSFEILLKDEQQIQFHCARFLMTIEFSGPILASINQARSSVRGFSNEYPYIFSWQDNYFLTNKHWNYIYDMMSSKKGAVWISKIMLPPSTHILEWLSQMRLNKGVDRDDLGQIRFYRLLRGFALQQEARDLNSAKFALKSLGSSLSSIPDIHTLSTPVIASAPNSVKVPVTTSPPHSPPPSHPGSTNDLSTISSPPGSSGSLTSSQGNPTILRSASFAGRTTQFPKNAEEVEIANLKEAFGMTFVSILEDNPSAIVHIEKAPVSSLGCFSANAISIILDKMVLLLKQGNIFVVSDLLINLDKHGLINPDIVKKIIDVVSSSEDYKPIRPAIRFLSSRTPSHLHLGVVINCLAAKDQDAQQEAVEALSRVANSAVQLSKESFYNSLHDYFDNIVRQEKYAIESAQTAFSLGQMGISPLENHVIPNTEAFGPFSAPDQVSVRRTIPDDMVITHHGEQKDHIEELYLLVDPSQDPHHPHHQHLLQHRRDGIHSCVQSGNSTIEEIPFLYSEEEWSLLMRTATSLLVDFVGLDLHKSPKNASFYNNLYEPRVRLVQCKHLASLLEMMESDEAGSRLLPFVLLGTTIRSNDYNRDTERLSIEAQLCILETIGKEYASHRRMTSNEFAHDLIEEVAKTSVIHRGLGYIFHDLLGQQAAKYAVMSEEIIKNKPDLLYSLNSWAFASLPQETRRRVFLELSLHEKVLVQQSIMEMVTNNQRLIEMMDPTDLTAVIASNFGPGESPIALKRCALRFLEISALYSRNQDYRLHAIDKIGYLLGKYGFHDPVVTEPLLRILDAIMSTTQVPQQPQHNNHVEFSPIKAKSKKTKMRSSFCTPSPFPDPPQRPTITPQEHSELFLLLTRNNMRQKLIQAFEAQSSNKFWTGKVLTCSLLRHFISPDSEDALEYVTFLKSTIPEIRSIALTELRKIDVSLVPALLQRLKELISYEEPLVRTTYSLVVGSLGLRPELQSMAVDVACFLIGKFDAPESQHHGVSILSILGEQVKNFAQVYSRVEDILLQMEAKLAKSKRLPFEDVGLLMALVECIATIGIVSPTILQSFIVFLRDEPDPALKTAVCLAIKKMSQKEIPQEQKDQAEAAIMDLFVHKDGYVRELAIKIVRFLGRDTIRHCAQKLIRSIADPEIYVRKQAIKAVTYLLYKGDDQTKKEALLLLPAVSSALEDKSPLVIEQSLKFLTLLRTRPKGVAATIARLAARAATHQLSGPDPEDSLSIVIDSDGIPVIQPSQTKQSSTPPNAFAETDDEDPWYIKKVIQPNFDRIVALLYRRRLRFNLPLKLGVLNVLGQTRLLQPHLATFTEMLNSENVPTLVELTDAIRKLGPLTLQYIPSLVNAIKPGSPLVRNLVRMLTRYEKQMDAKTCNKLFSLSTILSMMKNKDANVRKVAVSLMGKKVLEKPQHIWVIIQMWADKNNKVRKEVMEVLGDVGKRNPGFIDHMMNRIDTDSVSSVLVWRFLSKSWGILISNTQSLPPDIEEPLQNAI